MRDPVDKLIEWLSSQTQRPGSVDVSLELELGHMNGDGTITPCARTAINATTEGELGELAARHYQQACEHAEAFPTAQTYQLAIRELDAERPPVVRATTLFRVAASTPIGALSPTEPPSLIGVTAQLMRHLEASNRVNQALLTTTLTSMARELERKDRRLAELEASRSQSLDVLEAIATRVHEREIDRTRLERGEARKDEALRSLKLIGPPIVAAVANKLGLPASVAGNAHVEGLTQWLKSLTREQLAAILASGTPAQQAAVLAAYKALALADEPGFDDLGRDDS
jgi:hypothetical protein